MAIYLWRQWPTEIEAELLDRGHDVMDWHCGRMSSRRLLVLLRHAHTDGPYCKALRGGRQSRSERVPELVFNELAALRSSYFTVNGGADAAYEPVILRDPIDEVEHEEQLAREAEEQDEASEDFYSDMGWS